MSGLDLSESQVKTLQGLLSSSAILSVCGSSLICYQVVAGRKSNQTLHRMLLGLSIADIITSVRLAVLPPLLYPFETPSVGCTADGFITVLGYAGPYYNVAMSFYYLLTIRYNIRDDTIQQRHWEYIFHGIPILYAVSSAFIGLGIQAYNPSPFGLGCWINSYPSDRETNPNVECQRGQGAALFGLVGAVLPLLVVLISLITNNILIYRFVRTKEQRTERYASSRYLTSTVASSSMPSSSNTLTRQSSIMRSSTTTRDGPNISQKVAIQSFLYVAAFFASFIFSLILVIVSNIDPTGVQSGQYFALQALETFFYPLQGMFNCLTFIRPRYMRIRFLFPDKSWWYCFVNASFGTTLPPPSNRGRTSSNNKADSSTSKQRRVVVGSSSGVTDQESARHDVMPPTTTRAQSLGGEEEEEEKRGNTTTTTKAAARGALSDPELGSKEGSISGQEDHA